jgi:hypothetical protein
MIAARLYLDTVYALYISALPTSRTTKPSLICRPVDRLRRSTRLIHFLRTTAHFCETMGCILVESGQEGEVLSFVLRKPA